MTLGHLVGSSAATIDSTLYLRALKDLTRSRPFKIGEN